MVVILSLIALGHVEFVVAYVDLALVEYALPPNGHVPPHIPLDPNGCAPPLIPFDPIIPISNEVDHPIYEIQDPTIFYARFVEHCYDTSSTCCKILHGMQTLK
jgi:hypothetical protein